MSFKVKIEVEGYKEKWCSKCTYQERGYALIYTCLVFHKVLQEGEPRCPECIEAEKQYKEKENAK